MAETGYSLLVIRHFGGTPWQKLSGTRAYRLATSPPADKKEISSQQVSAQTTFKSTEESPAPEHPGQSSTKPWQHSSTATRSSSPLSTGLDVQPRTCSPSLKTSVLAAQVYAFSTSVAVMSTRRLLWDQWSLPSWLPWRRWNTRLNANVSLTPSRSGERPVLTSGVAPNGSRTARSVTPSVSSKAVNLPRR